MLLVQHKDGEDTNLAHLLYLLILHADVFGICTSVRQEHSLQTLVLFSIAILSVELTLIILFSRLHMNDIEVWEVLVKVFKSFELVKVTFGSQLESAMDVISFCHFKGESL